MLTMQSKATYNDKGYIDSYMMGKMQEVTWSDEGKNNGHGLCDQGTESTEGLLFFAN